VEVEAMAKILKAKEMSKCIGCLTCMSVCAGVNQQNHSLSKSRIRIFTKGGISGRFTAEVCQACREPACAEACGAGALTLRKGGGVLLKPDLCTGCRNCVDACLVAAVTFDEDTQTPLICKHCGVCAQYCPHGCLEHKEAAD